MIRSTQGTLSNLIRALTVYVNVPCLEQHCVLPLARLLVELTQLSSWRCLGWGCQGLTSGPSAPTPRSAEAQCPDLCAADRLCKYHLGPSWGTIASYGWRECMVHHACDADFMEVAHWCMVRSRMPHSSTGPCSALKTAG